MSEWLNTHKKSLLYVIFISFLVLIVFFLYIIRPLQNEEVGQRAELQRINTEIVQYQTQIRNLTVQTLTPLQKKALLDSVPIRPNVEQVIADLESTELETGVAIDNMSISVHPNEAQEQTWKHIIPEELFELLESQVTDVRALRVSYIELNVNLNGKEEDVHTFVKEVEKLKRTVHVQSYNYTVDEENGQVQGDVTFRAFYCEDFSEFIEDVEEFKLDYKFDPTKLHRYSEAVHELRNSTDSSTVPFLDKPATDTNLELVPVNPSQRYFQSKNTKDVETSNHVFYVVQTGGYNTEVSLYSQVTKLRNSGIYPREIERDPKQNNLSNTKYVVYTGVTHDFISAERLASHLSSLNNDFTSWVDQIPYQLNGMSAIEQAAQEVIAATTDVVIKGLTQEPYLFSLEQMEHILAKIHVYESIANEQ